MKFENFDIDEMRAEELDHIALSKGGEVGHLLPEHGKRRDESIENMELPGGWSCGWVKTFGKTDQGLLVLKANDPFTRELLKEGTFPRWQALGLSKETCEKLWRLRIPYKHFIAPQIKDIISNREKMEAWLKHPGTYGEGTTRFTWFMEHADEEGKLCYTGLSAPVESALARAVRYIYGTGNIEKTE